MLYKLLSCAFSASLVMGQWEPQKPYPDAISAVLPNKNTLPKGTEQEPTPNSVNGFLTLTILKMGTDERVQIEGQIKGLKGGQNYGFHVHEFGNIYKSGKEETLDLPPIVDCGQTGGHYNPLKKKHGGLDSEERHVGDLGNITAEPNGIAKVAITTKLKLVGDNSVIGRAFVIHADPDDGTPNVTPTGNSGGRLACGIIAVYGEVKPKPPVLKPSYIGCYNNANRRKFTCGKPSSCTKKFTMDTCATACAEQNKQYFGIQRIVEDEGYCACFSSLTDATENKRNNSELCKPNGGTSKQQYDLYFNPAIHAKTKNGLIKSQLNGKTPVVNKCIKRDGNTTVEDSCDSVMNQRWIFTDDKRILNSNNYEATCLALGKNHEEDGATIVNVQLCDNDDINKQANEKQWELQENGQIKHKGMNKCIAIEEGWSSDNGYTAEQVILFDCNTIQYTFDYSGIM